MLAALSRCARHFPVLAKELPARLASSADYPSCRPGCMNSHKRMADMVWRMVKLIESQNPEGLVSGSAAATVLNPFQSSRHSARQPLAQPDSRDSASGASHRE